MGIPGAKKHSKVGNSGLYPPEHYNVVEVYILDAPNPNVKNIVGGTEIKTLHQQKCERVKALFQDNNDYKVHDVYFPQGTRAKGVLEYWKAEINSKTINDLIIFYYDGKAGGEDEDYML